MSLCRETSCWITACLIGATMLSGCQSGANPFARKATRSANDISFVDTEEPKLSPPRKEPPSARTLVDFGFVRASMEQHADAINLFERAIREDSKYTDAYVGLAKSKMAMGHPDQAASAIKKGLKYQPKSAPLWNELGIAYTKMDKWPEAINALEKAIKHDPDEFLYKSNLAGVFAVTGKVDRAYKLYAQQMTEADAHCNIARILGGQGNTTGCRKHLEIALQADPTHLVARNLHSQINDPSLQTVGYRTGASQSQPSAARIPGKSF